MNNDIKIKSIFSRGKFFFNLLLSKVTGKQAPLMVTFSLTPRCNFDCVYCYGNYKERNKQKQFTTEEILKAIEDLAKLGTSFLQLSGGEPLIRNDIDVIVNKANELGITLGISTNGSLVEEKIETVKKIKTICVSFDGDKKSNDLNRGKGTYQKVMRAIDVALKAGINVHTYSTVNRNNINSLDYILKFAKDRGIYTEFGFPVVRTLKDDEMYRSLDLTPEEFKEGVKKILEYKKRGYPILFSKKIFEMVLKWPDYTMKVFQSEKEPSFEHVKCFGGKNMVFIDCDGKVYPCIQFIGKAKAFDFRKVGMKKAIEQSANHNCKACYLMCVNDFNLMFNLSLPVLWNNLKITFDEMKERT